MQGRMAKTYAKAKIAALSRSAIFVANATCRSLMQHEFFFFFFSFKPSRDAESTCLQYFIPSASNYLSLFF
jgi:hypothetical protein